MTNHLITNRSKVGSVLPLRNYRVQIDQLAEIVVGANLSVNTCKFFG